MDIVQRTVEVLTGAEKALAGLASEAAKESKYVVASSLINLAKDVADLASRARAQLDHSVKPSELVAGPLQTDKKAVTSLAQTQVRGRAKKADYPKFLRDGDNLLKLGWSPSEKAEYEHKSPKKVMHLLVGAISKAGTNGRRFSMDKILPLVDASDDCRVPDYQVYLCLAWLRALGFLNQHGRQGYSLTTRAPIEPLIETHWNALPTR